MNRTAVLMMGLMFGWLAAADFMARPAATSVASVGITIRWDECLKQKPEWYASDEAVRWFERARLSGIKWIEKADASKMKGYERVVVKDASAKPLWARFYEIGTNRPIFVGRDGIIKYDVAEIEDERRNNYQWYVNTSAKLLDEDYPAWQQKRIGR